MQSRTNVQTMQEAPEPGIGKTSVERSGGV